MYVQAGGCARSVTCTVWALGPGGAGGAQRPGLLKTAPGRRRAGAGPAASARACRLLRPGGEDRVVQEPVGRRRALLAHGHRRDEPVGPQVLQARHHKVLQYEPGASTYSSRAPTYADVRSIVTRG